MLNCTQILEGMSEKIRMGIEAAQTDLSKEKEKKQLRKEKQLLKKLNLQRKKKSHLTGMHLQNLKLIYN